MKYQCIKERESMKNTKELDMYRVTYAFDRETLYTMTFAATSISNAMNQFKKWLKTDDSRPFDSLLGVSVFNETRGR